MMDRDLIRRLQEERGLTPEEWLHLDEALDSDSARMTQSMLRSLPTEEPSMAWRSALNVRLAQTSKAQRQKRKILRWVPAMAAPVAAGCAIFMMMSTNAHRSSTTAPASGSLTAKSGAQESIEAQMMDFHRDSLTPVAIGANMPYEANSVPDLPITKF